MLTYADVCSEGEPPEGRGDLFRRRRGFRPNGLVQPLTSAYVRIRQHTSAYVLTYALLRRRRGFRPNGLAQPLTSAYVRIRQHTSAYVLTYALLRRRRGFRPNGLAQPQAGKESVVLTASARGCGACGHGCGGGRGEGSPNGFRNPRARLRRAYVSIRQHTSAYVSIRQHTCT
jgi:hypothetical protein